METMYKTAPPIGETELAFYMRKYKAWIKRAGELEKENRELKNALDDISEIVQMVSE